MKKLGLIAILVGLLTFPCETKECSILNNTCVVNNLTEELVWLKAEIQRREQSTSDVSKYFYIQQAAYKQQAIFVYNNCCPMCSTVLPVYNCQGELLFYLNEDPEERKEISNARVIWKPADFACLEN